MARPTDPNFLAGFDADAFRQAITSTMEMGLPEEESEQITFFWKKKRSFQNADRKGNPYDLSATPDSVEEHEPVKVPAAIEIPIFKPDGSPIGQFENPRAEVTLLDVHYAQVKGATHAEIGGNTYHIDYVTSMGLDEVNIYVVFMTAGDES